MIKISYKKFGILPVREYYFGYKKEKLGFLDNIFIFQVDEEINEKGFKKNIFNSGIIDLNQETEAILKNFSDTTRNEIKRAEKEGLQYGYKENLMGNDLVKYYLFYNEFLKAKGLKTISVFDIEKYKGHLFLTHSMLENDILNYHLYIIDKLTKKVRLLQSCSLFRKESDKNKINVIGYANRGLHYYDMKLFKELGYGEYDFGGLYLGTEDKQKINIDKFKLSFGPEIVTQYNYEKISLFINYFYKVIIGIGKIIKGKNK